MTDNRVHRPDQAGGARACMTTVPHSRREQARISGLGNRLSCRYAASGHGACGIAVRSPRLLFGWRVAA